MRQSIKKIGTTTMVHGTIEMFVPTATHVRQAIILMPVAFKYPPTVTVTIYNTSGGITFSVYGIDKVQQTGLYEVKVSAANAETGAGVPKEILFYCDYIIVGETNQDR